MFTDGSTLSNLRSFQEFLTIYLSIITRNKFLFKIIVPLQLLSVSFFFGITYYSILTFGGVKGTSTHNALIEY
jgi:hypothetical protein